MKPQNLVPKMFALGVLFIGAALLCLYFYLVAGGSLPRLSEPYVIRATVKEPLQLLPNADVRSAGVKVGTVESLEPRGSSSEIEMDIKEDLQPIYRDAKVAVRLKTLVGENYIEIKRGNRETGALPTNSELPPQADEEVVPIDRILNDLNPKTRTSVANNLQSLGKGFWDRGSSTNAMLRSLGPTFADGGIVLAVLEAQKGKLGRLVDNTGTVMQAIADRGSDAQTLVRAAKVTAETVADRDEQLQDAFEELPSTLDKARGSVATLQGFSFRATPVVRDLRVGLRELQPAVRDLTPSANAATALLREVPRLERRIDPTLSRLRTFTSTTRPAIPKLDALLRQINPALQYLKPFARDTGGTFAVFGAAPFYEKHGAIAYCTCPVSQQSFSNYTPEMQAAVDQLIKSGSGILGQRISTLGNNPIRRPNRLPDSSYEEAKPYPKVNADRDRD